MNMETLLRLPWTLSIEERHDDGFYLVARVAELKGLVATGETEQELEASFWEALEAHLEARLAHGHQIPMPPGVKKLDLALEVARQTDGRTCVSGSFIGAATWPRQAACNDNGILAT